MRLFVRAAPLGLMGVLLLGYGCSTSGPSAPSAPSSPPEAVEPAQKMNRTLSALIAAPNDQLRELREIFAISFDPVTGEPLFKVIFKHPLGSSTQLTPTADVRHTSRFGRFGMAYVTRDGARALANHPGIERIEAVRAMSIDNDISAADSSIATSDGNTAFSFATSGTPAPIVVPFAPAKAGQQLTVKMSKGGAASPGLAMTSTLKICKDQACTQVVATGTNNDGGGDAKVSYTFPDTAPYYIQCSANITSGTAPFPFALTFSGDSTKGTTLGTKAKATGKDGSGVIVGIVDTGIDFCHPDFIDPATGKSRILYLWDHSLTPTGAEKAPTEFPTIGVEYTNADINASLASCAGGNPTPVRTRDTDAHGTHVAGTAAGNGQATNDATNFPAGTFAGAAPKADIIMVKGLGTGITTQHLDEALQYVHLRAKAIGKPVAMNNSWGGWGDAQDGTSLQEQVVSSVAGRGSLAMFAGGNIGYFRAHATQPPTIPAKGTADSFQLKMLTCGGDGGAGTCQPRPVSFWTEGGDSYDITLTDNSNNTATWLASEANVSGLAKSVGSVKITMYADTAPEPNGSKNYYLDIPPAASAANEFWTLSITRTAASTGGGKWDAFVGPGGSPSLYVYDPAGTPATAIHIVRNPALNGVTSWTPGQVHMPGTGFGVLQVAAVTGNVRWWDNSAQADEPGNTAITFKELANLAYYSSRGPTRDGRMNPQIAAPGTNVLSSASQFATLPATSLSKDGKHASFSGTSMATPNTTGAIALMLQADPTNFPRPLAKNTAKHDTITSDSANQGWHGAGRIDALNAITKVMADVAPVAASVTALPTHAQPGTIVKFTVDASDADGTVEEYLWDIDSDGYTDFFTSTPTLSFDTTGAVAKAYTATVVVADNYGKTAQTTVPWTVDSPPDAGTDAPADAPSDAPADAPSDATGGGGEAGSDGGATDAGSTDGAADGGATDGGTTDGGTTDGGTTDGGLTDGGSDAGKSDGGAMDAGGSVDSGAMDSGSEVDSGGGIDSGSDNDSGASRDAGGAFDSGASSDSGASDAGDGDGGSGSSGGDNSGCGCKVAGAPGTSNAGIGGASLAALGLLAFAGRARRRKGRANGANGGSRGNGGVQ